MTQTLKPGDLCTVADRPYRVIVTKRKSAAKDVIWVMLEDSVPEEDPFGDEWFNINVKYLTKVFSPDDVDDV